MHVSSLPCILRLFPSHRSRAATCREKRKHGLAQKKTEDSCELLNNCTPLLNQAPSLPAESCIGPMT